MQHYRLDELLQKDREGLEMVDLYFVLDVGQVEGAQEAAELELEFSFLDIVEDSECAHLVAENEVFLVKLDVLVLRLTLAQTHWLGGLRELLVLLEQTLHVVDEGVVRAEDLLSGFDCLPKILICLVHAFFLGAELRVNLGHEHVDLVTKLRLQGLDEQLL